MSPQPDTVDRVKLSPRLADVLAGVIVAAAAVGLGVVCVLNGEILAAVAFSALLLGLARAAGARSVVADSSGLRFCDGLFSHHLGWDQIDGFTVDRGVVHVLHDGRFVDRLPLPGTRYDNGQDAVVVAERLRALHSASPNHGSSTDSARILGGIRGRLGLTVVRVEEDGSLTWLQGPSPALDQFVAMVRLKRNRRRAESTRQAEAQRIGDKSR